MIERQASGYSSPPTAEEIALAKRAAELTRKKWAESAKEERAKENAKSAKKKSAQDRKNSSSEKRAKKKLGAPRPPKSNERAKENHRSQKKNSSAIQRDKPRPGQNSTPAQKLGISDDEFNRRINALRKFRSE